MAKKVCVIVTAFFLAACGGEKNVPGSRSEAPSAVPPSVERPAFEIRNFSIESEDGEYTDSHKGTGVLVAKSEGVRKGQYLVFLTRKAVHDNGKIEQQLVTVSDGIGDVRTFDYSEKAKDRKIEYVDWKILGYTPLQDADLTSDGSAAIAVDPKAMAAQ